MAKKSVRKKTVRGEDLTQEMLLDYGVLKWVHVSEFGVVGGYQRELNRPRVKRMVTKFDRRVLGLVITGRRNKNGMYPVIDGQHRLAAVEEKFPDGFWENGKPTMILTLVLDVEDSEQYLIYKLLNDSDTKSSNKPNDIFKADLAGGEASALDVQRTLDEQGITIGFGTGKARVGMTKSPAAFLELYGVCGGLTKFTTLIEMLRVSFSRPDGTAVEAAALQATFVRGLTEFMRTTAYTPETIARAMSLSTVSAADIVRRATQLYAENRYAQLDAVGYVLNRIIVYELAAHSGVKSSAKKSLLASLTPRLPRGELKAAQRPASPLKPKAKKKKVARRKVA